ncbi:dTDP-4-dehydrorhamnose 3,5-epimerase family protein [Falsiroseomonas oryziterrae]|uniref:dTDP-4-dehydrorhamnose 3,5-epimerase family protein n=1 Tax=Falsiroseomonas oryziterrae TaxID=2911368 RepID=UPI001F3DF622|nr:dTDP-4-dehydrorhamnose 3,5-epimerase family protein [Roseomonas sp. NPKOSM-4]
MIFRATAIEGVMEILPERARDARGAFFRGFCAAEFAAAGLDFRPVQVSYSENPRRHTLRGLHWQAPPAAERKLVRCLRGAVHDVALDLRDASATRGAHVGMTLSAEAGNALLIPPGCAHGFLTLTDDVLLEYMMDVPHAPGHARGLRWNDPAFGIAWPAAPAVISERDATWPDHG